MHTAQDVMFIGMFKNGLANLSNVHDDSASRTKTESFSEIKPLKVYSTKKSIITMGIPSSLRSWSPISLSEVMSICN